MGEQRDKAWVQAASPDEITTAFYAGELEQYMKAEPGDEK